MSSNYIKKSDFVGEIRIAQNTKEVNTLEYYIDKYEKEILLDLLGYLQYQLYVDQISSNTGLSSQNKYKVLITGKNFKEFHVYNTATQFFYYDKQDNYTSYYGMIESLKYFIYWYFVRDLRAKVTSVGVKFPLAENSENPNQNQINSVIEQRYNEAIKGYISAYNLLDCLHEMKVHYHSIVDNGDNTYTIKLIQLFEKNSYNVAHLIQTSDKIILDKKEYFVLSNDLSTDNESYITIEDQSSGLTFENTFFTIDPFIHYTSVIKEFSVLDGTL